MKNMKPTTIEIVQSARNACITASMQPWDEADHGSVILSSVLFHLSDGMRHPILKTSTTDWFWDKQ
jgi:hypothetical protein